MALPSSEILYPPWIRITLFKPTDITIVPQTKLQFGTVVEVNMLCEICQVGEVVLFKSDDLLAYKDLTDTTYYIINENTLIRNYISV